MNLFQHFQAEVEAAVGRLADAGALPADGLAIDRITVEPPRDPEHGEVATNAAMVLAKAAGMKPRDLAEKLAEALRGVDDVAAVEVAGPGFINLRLAESFWHRRLNEIVAAGVGYGDSQVGTGRRVNVEYVSANPTGPLHVAHARGSVVGDALVNLLRKAGFDVTSEFYVNDAGAQVAQLARSAHLRYREAHGEEIGEIPEGLYPGEYMKLVGKVLKDEFGDHFLDAPESEWLAPFTERAVAMMLNQIKADLKALGIEQDVFTSERHLVATGRVDHVLEVLEEKGLLYRGVLEPPKGKAAPEDWEPREQLLFRATEFGDDMDRPLKKSDGSWTYFSNDIANHLDKFERGFATMIDIWGADHGGYVKRMQAAVKAVTGGAGDLDVLLCQMVHLQKGGAPVRMSKRAGTFITLRDLIDEVGKDVVRFIMLTRKNDSQMEFDLEKVTEQSRDNPVFYVQYAHARCCSVLRNADDPDYVAWTEADHHEHVDHALLDDAGEVALIKRMAEWPRIVEGAAEAHEPHRIAFYLYDLASDFHQHWNRGKDEAYLRFIDPADKPRTRARLDLVRGVRNVIASGLAVMGVTPVEELR